MLGIYIIILYEPDCISNRLPIISSTLHIYVLYLHKRFCNKLVYLQVKNIYTYVNV